MSSREGSLSKDLAHKARAGESAEQIADEVAATAKRIESALTPIVGAQGVAALFRRSLLLARRQHTGLAGIAEPPAAAESLDVPALQASLAQMVSVDAALAGGAWLETFQGLVAGLIGTPLKTSIAALPVAAP